MALAILCNIIKDFVYQEFSAGPATALRLFANGDTLPDQQSRREHLGIKKEKCLGPKKLQRCKEMETEVIILHFNGNIGLYERALAYLKMLLGDILSSYG